jgi:hypothetical protein
MPSNRKFKKVTFQHQEGCVNSKKEERSVAEPHEHRTSRVNARFDVEIHLVFAS